VKICFLSSSLVERGTTTARDTRAEPICEYRVKESHWTWHLLAHSLNKRAMKPHLAKCGFIGWVGSKVLGSVNQINIQQLHNKN